MQSTHPLPPILHLHPNLPSIPREITSAVIGDLHHPGPVFPQRSRQRQIEFAAVVVERGAVGVGAVTRKAGQDPPYKSGSQGGS